MRVDLVCNDLQSSFDSFEIVGEGSYGVVTKCKRKSNGEIVAIKFIKKYGDKNNNNNEDEKQRDYSNKKGLRIDVYREIQILNCLYDNDLNNNINYDFTNNRITKLQQILIGSMCENKYNLALVFEYYELSLSQIIRYHRKKLKKLFSNIFIAQILYQILEGVYTLHNAWILHRDLKPSNILIDVANGGIIKLCDFGLSKIFQKYQTNGVHKQQKDGEIVTLYYRSPELFLTKNINKCNKPSIDIWSIGCIFAELINLKPLFKIEIDKINHNAINKELLKNICYIMGLPDNETWNGVQYLDYYNIYIHSWKMKYDWRGCLPEKIKSATFLQMDLVKKLLIMDPKKRISVKHALNHNYFNILSTNNNNQNKKLLLFPNGQCPYEFI